MNYEELTRNVDSYPLIGEGGHRKVYNAGSDLVLKVASDENTELEYSTAVNLSEFRIYQEAEDKGFLCPALWVSEDGVFLVMKNANQLGTPTTNQTEDEFMDHMLFLGCEEYDLESPFNWVGHYLVDYGVLEIKDELREEAI